MLLTFVVVHVLGNLSFFAGPAAFNGYAAKLHNPLTTIIEIYLLLAAALHLGAGVYLTWRFKLPQTQTTPTPTPAKVADILKLALTGGVVLVFLVAHLSHFRFGPDYRLSRRVLVGVLSFAHSIRYRMNALSQEHPRETGIYTGCRSKSSSHSPRSRSTS
jgi:succinate dehydrogenase/fumarate reductase cytochrome b subunit